MRKEIEELQVGQQLEHTLHSGEIMVLDYQYPNKIEVIQIASNEEDIRWSKVFISLEAAEKEYYRFD